MALVHVRPQALTRTEARGAVIQVHTAKRVAAIVLRLLVVVLLVRIPERAPCRATATRTLGNCDRLAGEGLNGRTSDHDRRTGQVLLLLLLHHVVMCRHRRRHHVRRGRGRCNIANWAWWHRRRHEWFLLVLLVLHPLLLTRVDATESRHLKQRHRGGGVALLLHVLLLVVHVLRKQNLIIVADARSLVAV
jgi:hypothetical protein